MLTKGQFIAILKSQISREGIHAALDGAAGDLEVIQSLVFIVLQCCASGLDCGYSLEGAAKEILPKSAVGELGSECKFHHFIVREDDYGLSGLDDITIFDLNLLKTYKRHGLFCRFIIVYAGGNISLSTVQLRHVGSQSQAEGLLLDSRAAHDRIAVEIDIHLADMYACLGADCGVNPAHDDIPVPSELDCAVLVLTRLEVVALQNTESLT